MLALHPFLGWLLQMTNIPEEFSLPPVHEQGSNLSLHFKKSSLRQIKAAKPATESFLGKK
jgi:hypothetical protein